MKIFKIYKLFHPLSTKMYIGKTYDIDVRLIQHIYEKRINKRTSWIKSLKLKHDQIPFLEIIHDNISNEEWANSYERSWISYYRNNYGKENILNMTDGGDGQCGLKHSAETKIKMSHAKAGRHISPMTEFKKGNNPIHKFPKGHTGINGGNTGHVSPLRKLKDIDIQNIRELWKDGLSTYALAKEFSVDRTAIGNIIKNRTYKGLIKQ